MTTLENVIVRNVRLPSDVLSTTEDRLWAASLRFNPRKYNVLGFVNRTQQVVLQPRFYNVRDEKGRWAKIRQSR